MKEYPIIFSTSMVQAVLNGSKTQTRRVIKPQPSHVYLSYSGRYYFDGVMSKNQKRVGDRLWVRETFTWVTLGEKDPWKDKAMADGTFRRMPNGEPVKVCYKADGYEIGAPWRPSIHMPRWASRITLEITEVRAQKVQEITGEDVEAEGIEICGHLLKKFIRLWDSLNAKRGYGWDFNPWVFVISFKKIDK